MSDHNLIEDWKDAIGLTITKVESFVYESDDPTYFHQIYFNNGQIAIQEDQESYTTRAGLVCDFDLNDRLKMIERSKKLNL